MFYNKKKEFSEPKEVMAVAMRLLAMRDHGELELANKLSQKGASEEFVAKVIAECIEQGWLNDEKFCQILIKSKVNKGLGKIRIKMEAKQKGLSESLINSCLNSNEIDWFKSALTAYNKKFSTKPITDYKDKAKCMRYLQYRGFSNDEISYAIEQGSRQQDLD